MPLEKITIGENAFTDGYLNKQLAQKVANRTQREIEVSPSEAGKVLQTEDKIVIQFLGQTVNFDAWLSGTLVRYAIVAQYVSNA